MADHQGLWRRCLRIPQRGHRLGSAGEPKLLGRWVKAKPLTWFHESLGIGALLATLVHVGVLSVHDFLDFSWAEILVPGLSDWRPLAVTAGIGALYGLVLVSTSFYFKRWIGQKAWRTIHFASFGVFVTSLLHGVWAGTDTSSPMMIGLYLGSAIVVFSLLALRIVTEISGTAAGEGAGSTGRGISSRFAGQMTDPYRDTIKELSDRIVEAQKPIKVLNAINWDDSIKEKFFASEFKELPAVDHAYYETRETKLDPEATRNELRGIEADLQAKLGPVSPAGNLMRFMCEQFRQTVDLLEARGTPGFSPIASLLYGTPHDVFHAGGPDHRRLVPPDERCA